MNTSKVVNQDGSIEIYFEKIGHWDDFDLILGILQQENGCQIRSNEEMVYIRQAKILWRNINFELIQDDMLGNFILTKNPEDVGLLEKLATNVINSIKEKLDKAHINHN